jgi:hypothetical protein
VVLSTKSGNSLRLVVHDLFLKDGTIEGTFSPGQTIANDNTNAIVVRSEVLPIITGVTLVSAGSDFAPDDQIVITTSDNAPGVGATGRIVKVANSAIGTISTESGGQGFVDREPIVFTSSSGVGASGFARIDTPTAVGEILLDLTVEPYLDNPVFLDTGANWSAFSPASVNFDTALSVVFALVVSKPFFTPWVWTNAANTTASLAEASLFVENYASQPFVSTTTATTAGYTGKLFLLANIADVTTTLATTVSNATPIGYFDTLAGNTSFDAGRQTRLYLSGITNPTTLALNKIVKQDYRNVQTGTVTITTGSASAVGTNTNFISTITGNAHVRVGNATVYLEGAVDSVQSDTEFTLKSASTISLTANLIAT